ncbi:PREDICTED: uncharacterized protein LOC104759855 [Camelina sativa]|uniref:Uncharacterized protein LOC104759855 n=1 Tax=Camelina sativa TaxID=90675 RepID=A0ABM0X5I4_CAMSA|nr:PREDICTED: uncharacterized protein LOC104759855 [Camelina sativa]
MKTKAGTETVMEVQCSEKLKRRAAAKGRTVAESAMIRAFNAQFSEYSSELKKARALQEKESDTGVRLRDKYWPVSAFDVAINILHEEVILDFCRKEEVKSGLYKFVEGLIERKMVSFGLREASNLRDVLKEMASFEVPVSSKDGNYGINEKRNCIGSRDENCGAGEKGKDIGSVLGHGGETSANEKL